MGTESILTVCVLLPLLVLLLKMETQTLTLSVNGLSGSFTPSDSITVTVTFDGCDGVVWCESLLKYLPTQEGLEALQALFAWHVMVSVPCK